MNVTLVGDSPLLILEDRPVPTIPQRRLPQDPVLKLVPFTLVAVRGHREAAVASVRPPMMQLWPGKLAQLDTHLPLGVYRSPWVNQEQPPVTLFVLLAHEVHEVILPHAESRQQTPLFTLPDLSLMHVEEAGHPPTAVVEGINLFSVHWKGWPGAIVRGIDPSGQRPAPSKESAPMVVPVLLDGRSKHRPFLSFTEHDCLSEAQHW